jgi:hypothetical protein
LVQINTSERESGSGGDESGVVVQGYADLGYFSILKDAFIET